jgi:hypothetical protein
MVAPTLPAIRRKVLGDLLEARLKLLPGDPTVSVYRGEVPKSPPRVPDSDRVASYVVLFDGTGPKNLEPSVCGTHEDLSWSPSITIASGFSPDCAQTIDRVYAWVYGWSPVINGLAFGRLVPPLGFDPGPVRPDTTVSPVRFFVSTSWVLDATT